MESKLEGRFYFVCHYFYQTPTFLLLKSENLESKGKSKPKSKQPKNNEQKSKKSGGEVQFLNNLSQLLTRRHFLMLNQDISK